MVKCCAPMCVNSTYRKSPDITFHRFPKDEHLKNAWLKSLNRKDWQPNSSCVLCSEHFEGHLLDRSGFRTVLAHGAIPTIFFSPQESKENQQALPTEKTPVKRTARGGYILQDLQNIGHHMPSTSGTQRESSTSHVPPRIENIGAGTGSSCVPLPAVSTPIVTDVQVKKLKQKTLLQTKKIKALKQQNRRLKTKVSKFSDIISSLKEKINHDDVHILSGIGVENKDFFVRYLKKAKQTAVEKTFSPELRSFALQRCETE